MFAVEQPPLSALLAVAVPEGDRERKSLEIGEPANAISRWISRDVLPGPAKYRKVADLLGISVPEVGAALAVDALDRWEQRHVR